MVRKYWMIVLVLLLLLFGFGSTLLTGYLVAFRSLGEEIKQNTLPLTSDNIYSEIQKDLVRSIHISSQMAHDTFVKDWVLDGERQPERMVKYLGEIQKTYRTVTAFFVSEGSRRYYHPDGVLKTVSPDDPGDGWYFRARAMNTPYEINIDSDTADRSRLTIFVNHQTRDNQGRLIGLIGVGLELRQVQETLASYRRKYMSDVFFVDKAGMVVIRTKDSRFAERLADWDGFRAQEAILRAPEGAFEYKTGGHVYFGSWRFIPEVNLVLLILKNGDALQEKLGTALKRNLAVGFMITLVVVVLVAVLLKRHHAVLEGLASVDGLTGAYTRRAFSVLFSQAVRESRRSKSPLSLVLIDIDDFKPVNDRLSHEAGDRILRDLCRSILEKIRQSDVLCRWGGDEFVLLLASCPILEAWRIAEKIRGEIAEKPLQTKDKGELYLTISAGVVAHRPEETLEQLVSRADGLMYEAKKKGRNVVVAEAPDE